MLTLGSPPPVPSVEDHCLSMQSQQQQQQIGTMNTGNALPLPPRDRSRPLIQLKTHQRRHPLVLPSDLVDANESTNGLSSLATAEDLPYDSANHDSPPLVHRHVPVLKQVSCPQAPAAFLSVYNKTNNGNFIPACTNLNECDKTIPQPKPNRTCLYALLIFVFHLIIITHLFSF